MNLSSFFINDRKVSHLEINGRAVRLRQEPVLCDALCFTAQEPGSTVKITKIKAAPTVNLQTSTDGNSWNPYTVNDVITLANANDKVYFKAVGSNSAMATSQSDYNKFVMTGKIAASGNVNSLLEEDELTARTMSLEGKVYCYYNMFNGCISLTQAPELPSTTLASDCYNNMFGGCTSLTQAPELPATILAKSCYKQMFSKCTSLTQAPVLPATTLADWCYNSMLIGCSSLTQAPSLPAMTLASSCYRQMFQNCSSLTTAPELPATTLANYCYANMFYGCTSLATAPALPATTLADNCYDSMFYGCTSLTTSPELHSTTLARGCYQSMFKGCTSLTTAPELPATTLAGNCYNNMLSACTSLTQAPSLPATTLAEYCYSQMFQNCSSLTTAPELPATTLANSCYNSMFYNCKSLTQAPELPATTLANYCYRSMFYGCTKLNTITLGYTGNFADAPSNAFNDWVAGVSSTGTFYYNGSDTTTGTSAIPTGWTVLQIPSPSQIQALCFTAQEPGSTVKITKNDFAPVVNLQTSTDGNSWTPYNVEDVITLANVDDKVYFKAVGSNSAMGSWTTNYNKFEMTGKIAASGNVNSLLEEDEQTARTMSLAGKKNCYYQMFQNCSSLTQAPELPATTLADNCYQGMFSGCSSLTQAPELPATTLASSCYANMFYGCTSLTQAPKLPATTLVAGCYQSMFYGCTSLTTAPELPATTLVGNCYESMFKYCTSLTQAPELPATTLAVNCYRQMFQNCSSLTTAPELPATTLTMECYSGMFSGCKSLTQAPELPATTLDSNCYSNMFSECTSLNQAPELPATELYDFCYNSMFYGCTNLNTIKLGYTGNFADAPEGAFSSWVDMVSSNGTFYYNGSDKTRGTSAIPEGWVVVSPLCFTAQEYNSTVSMQANGSAPSVSLEYSTDGNTWSPFEIGTTTVNLANIGDKVYMRATSSGNSQICNMEGQNQFYMSGRIAASGNVDTLLDQNGNATLTDYCYYGLFRDCTCLTTAPDLPATELVPGCYSNMFENCTNLNYVKVGFTNWYQTNATYNWLPENTGTFECPQQLIDNTTERTTSTVPSSWTMTAV